MVLLATPAGSNFTYTYSGLRFFRVCLAPPRPAQDILSAARSPYSVFHVPIRLSWLKSETRALRQSNLATRLRLEYGVRTLYLQGPLAQGPGSVIAAVSRLLFIFLICLNAPN